MASFRITRQRLLVSKIKRGKCNFKHYPNEKILALAEHDLKHLIKTDKEFQQRTVELRRKIHEETLNNKRLGLSDVDSRSALSDKDSN